MKSIIKLLSITFLIAAVSCQDSKSPVQSAVSELQTKLDKLLDDEYNDYMNEYPEFPGGMALQVSSQYGDVFVHKGFSESVTNRHHIRAQSITKTFTAAGIMVLFQRGLLDVHDFITDPIPYSALSYIPETPQYNIPYKNEIRIWDLLNHRAGVFDPVNDDITYVDSVLAVNPDHTFTLDEVIGYVSKLQLSYFAPGEGWHYSNAGYVILAKIIERVSGKSYRQFMNDEFVVPLGLINTSFPDQGTEQSLPYPYVDSYYWSEALTVKTTEQNMTYDIGEGNMISSIEDLCNFFEALFNGNSGVDFVKVNNYMMDCRPTSDVGSRSWGAGLEYLNGLGYGHGGDAMGYTTHCVYDPENDLMITFFFNCWNFKYGEENPSYFFEQKSMMYDFLYRVKEEVTLQ